MGLREQATLRAQSFMQKWKNQIRSHQGLRHALYGKVMRATVW